jgi:hypothetical protein
MSATTRTTERIESTVETVEIEEVQCPICEQWYADDEELVAVAVGATYEPDGEVVTAAHDTLVCQACTDSLFGVTPEPGRIDRIRDALSRPLVDLGDVSVPSGAIRAIASVAVGLAVTGVVLNEVLTTVSQEVEPAEIEQVAAPAFTVLDLVPMLALVVVVWAVLNAPRILGGRR